MGCNKSRALPFFTQDKNALAEMGAPIDEQAMTNPTQEYDKKTCSTTVTAYIHRLIRQNGANL